VDHLVHLAEPADPPLHPRGDDAARGPWRYAVLIPLNGAWFIAFSIACIFLSRTVTRSIKAERAKCQAG